MNIPDIDRQTQGVDLYEAIKMAEDLLATHLTEYEDQKKQPPRVTPITDIVLSNKADILTLVAVDTLAHRKKYDNQLR